MKNNFYLWDLELLKFNRKQDSVIERVVSKKELKTMYPNSKIYNPQNMPILLLKTGELVFVDAGKVYV